MEEDQIDRRLIVLSLSKDGKALMQRLSHIAGLFQRQILAESA